MGTTKTMLQAGSSVYKLIALIEGYSHPLTDATEAQAQAALTGTDWASATIIPGLTVQLQNEQRLDPWQPFHGGGSCSLSIVDSISDTFGIDTHRKTAGDETKLSTSLDSNDATVTVLSTTGFASSGDMHIGTECIAYTGTTATTFTTCTRGKYSPFGVDGGTRFGHPHRVRNDPNGVAIQPLVTEHPRTWLGRMVGVWAHRVSGGVLDTKAQAQLVFAGRIVELRDDPGTMSTIVQCAHVLDHLAETTLGREMWSAKIKDGVYLETGMTFAFKDTDDYGAAVFSEANALSIVASGAAGTNQANAGLYSQTELHNILNIWWAGEFAAPRIGGQYSIGLVGLDEDTRVKINGRIAGAAGDPVAWSFGMPHIVAEFMGFASRGHTNNGLWYISLFEYEVGTVVSYTAPDVPYRSLIRAGVIGGLRRPTLTLIEERGTFADQYSTLPDAFKPTAQQGLEWGMFVIDDTYTLSAAKTGATLAQIKAQESFLSVRLGPFGQAKIARSYGNTEEMRVRQVFMIEMSFAGILKALLYSTGTSGYNHATYDVLPFGLGLAIPGTLLGDTCEATIDALPGALTPQTLVIDKPTAFANEFSGDLVIRWAFPVWRDQIIRFSVWASPVSGASVATLSESTKAAPAGQRDDHRTATMLTNQWQRPIVKWQYDRDLTNLGSDAFRSSVTFEDPRAIDDAGGVAAPVTISLRHINGEAARAGGGVDQAIKAFLRNLSMFTQGSHISTRSIDPRYYEGYAPGDIVYITDEFARDPDTGTRGVSRYGMIVAHRYQLGGGVPGEGSEMSGEVDVLFLERDNVMQYVPCAQVDDTQANGGYNAGTKVLTCYAHRHSESGEAADASWFTAGSLVRVIEIDPVDPAAPATWDNGVVSQTGNTITLTLALTGWDAALKYRVVSDSYADASATQQAAYAYQADDADGFVADARVPFEYGAATIDTTTVTANSASDQLELTPTACAGDGIGRDIGHEAAHVRLCNSLIDYKTAHSSPVVQNTAISAASITGSWFLLVIRPVYLGGDIPNAAAVTRNVSVSACFRSKDGSSVSVRISLCRTLPTGSSFNDVDRGTFYDSQTFTSTSTSWVTATAANLTATVKNLDGVAWVLIEGSTDNTETRGVCKLQVSARSYT
jgi:hypothetical protein